MKYKRSWNGAYKRGLYYLSRHKTQKALMEFEEAARCCPVSSAKNLAKILYYMGIALDRLGQGSLAVKSWINARRLVKRKSHTKRILRWVNGYGMRCRSSSESDDYYAFRIIQIKNYFDQRHVSYFASDPEEDMVCALIDDAWKLLRRSGILRPLSVEEKLGMFKRARIDFPLVKIESLSSGPNKIITADFRSGAAFAKRVRPDSPCPCRSGLAFRMCCGRIEASDPLSCVVMTRRA